MEKRKNDPKNKGRLPPMSIVMTNGPVSTTTMTTLIFQPWSQVVTKAEVIEVAAMIVTIVRTKKKCSNNSSSDLVVRMNNVSEEEMKESPSKLRLKDVRISFLPD